MSATVLWTDSTDSVRLVRRQGEDHELMWEELDQRGVWHPVAEAEYGAELMAGELFSVRQLALAWDEMGSQSNRRAAQLVRDAIRDGRRFCNVAP